MSDFGKESESDDDFEDYLQAKATGPPQIKYDTLLDKALKPTSFHFPQHSLTVIRVLPRKNTHARENPGYRTSKNLKSKGEIFLLYFTTDGVI